MAETIESLRAENARLTEDRDYFKESYARKLKDEKRALEIASAALAENTRQSEVHRRAVEHLTVARGYLERMFGGHSLEERLRAPVGSSLGNWRDGLLSLEAGLEVLAPTSNNTAAPHPAGKP